MQRYEHIGGPARVELSNRLAEEYTNGRSIRELAAELGRSYGFVHRLLQERPDFRLRPRGARPKKISVSLTEGASHDPAA